MEGNGLTRKSPPQNACIVIWLHSAKKILSFRPQPGFEQRSFPNKAVMWEEITELIDEGYRVQ